MGKKNIIRIISLIFLHSSINNAESPTLQRPINHQDSDKQSILRGAQLHKSLIENDRISIVQSKSHYTQSIIDLISFYYAVAVLKKQGFTEGSFIIADPHGAIFEYLKENPHTYARKSSHFRALSSFTHDTKA